ncbi:hypothetical protein Bca4012_042579 [Brassica carinata]|uniref:BnaC09g14730D protein n=4 Tax=Brassica TaxID=3705 RepID=A0A078ID02_BRANA|nr:hypothetical protein HID58_085885 [Brassica napus]CAF1724924.1 unnamed protein product [Brassica napus]CDY47224.1 BnaC09g14730D [Brassica napus]VDD29772.1 unnamed protein product [Brassica oleracea]
MKCRHKLIYRKLIMKRNHGLRRDYSKKKQLFQSLSSAYCIWPLNLVDESWPCDLSVVNGYDSPMSLCAVEDRYPVRSSPLRGGRTVV